MHEVAGEINILIGRRYGNLAFGRVKELVSTLVVEHCIPLRKPCVNLHYPVSLRTKQRTMSALTVVTRLENARAARDRILYVCIADSQVLLTG